MVSNSLGLNVRSVTTKPRVVVAAAIPEELGPVKAPSLSDETTRTVNVVCLLVTAASVIYNVIYLTSTF